ncbi:MAG: phosphatase PAP2 family protein, partial [Acidimicrobiales bacterium]
RHDRWRAMTDARNDVTAAEPEPVVTAVGPQDLHDVTVRPQADDERWSGLRAAARAVDQRVDGWFEPIRGRPALDGTAKLITGLGDHGLMWAGTTVWRARRSGPERAQAVRALAVAGIESRLVNSTLKRSIGRSRPDRTGLKVTVGVVPVREPTTSSFPSGHTLAAFCAATVMCRPDDRGGNVLLLTCATLVGLSRLHLGAHHASDVVGGAMIGTAIGLIGRLLI